MKDTSYLELIQEFDNSYDAWEYAEMKNLIADAFVLIEGDATIYVVLQLDEVEDGRLKCL